MASITVNRTKPGAEKEGFILQQVYDAENHMIAWTYVPDPDYVVEEGTYINPIQYVVGADVIEGKWYTDGDNIWEAIKSGIPSSFEDTEYFDIIVA